MKSGKEFNSSALSSKKMLPDYAALRLGKSGAQDINCCQGINCRAIDYPSQIDVFVWSMGY